MLWECPVKHLVALARHRGKNDDRQCSYVGKNVRV